ncbi:DUF488 domain-containing protein [Flaviaesturariibacter amylovorans]|uniref:DUF488 domain-containing protein n=1 Tax=Flaviaesturariibacter amylovorans TaxID=1084520 RepID=A0ABP8HIE7_9BACT
MGKINLQKLLFIVSKRQSETTYDFVPYKFGAYSYSANADLSAMVKHGFLIEDETSFEKKDKLSYLMQLNAKDKQLVKQMHLLFKDFDADALMKYTYRTYPESAINSTTADRLMTPAELKAIQEKKPFSRGTILYTIGYEGISLEGYLNKLLKHDIKVLVDVRRNALSQKYGFSKNQLAGACRNINIEYIHFSDVGIHSDERQELNTQDDYDLLFESYRQRTLSETLSTQHEILELLKEKERIALTCFEKNICQCHRKHLSEAIMRLPGWQYELKHI